MNGCEMTYLDEIHLKILNGRAFLVLIYFNILSHGILIKVDLSKKCI
jgi:hypothetical protein